MWRKEGEVARMRDRLIKLLNGKYDHFCDQCGVNKDSRYTDDLADHLLDNGVIVPPCKVGDTVYALWNVPTEAKYIVYCAEVKKISQYTKNCRLTSVIEIEPIEFRGRRKEYQFDEIGKTVFLSEAEAKYALKNRRSVSLVDGHIEE